MSETGKDLLEGAYRLDTPESNRRYYKSFAAHYDTDFVQEMGYIYPAEVARIYGELNAARDAIADIGCGTGSLAQVLGAGVIDGFDISPEMLAIAQGKGLYRNVYEVDLTAPLDPNLPRYAAILSAGTFTHGHLGPDALENLLGLALPNAVFCIGINSAHYQSHGFESRLELLQNAGRIAELHHQNVPIYAGKSHEHAADAAVVVTFQAI